VSQQPTIQVTFNSGSAPSNVTSDNFTVTGPTGQEDGQVSWDPATRTATWVTRPINSRETAGLPLGMASNYTATVSGFSGGPYSFTFQTGPCAPPAVYAATTQIIDVGSSLTNIFGVNNAGVVSGWAISAGTSLGFIYNHGRVTNLKDFANKINDNNAVVGTYPTPGGPSAGGFQRGYLYQNGQYTDIIDPQATQPRDQDWAYGINNLGVIVGHYVANDQTTGQTIKSSGFIRQPDGTYTDFQQLPEDINNSGHIVVWTGNTSFLYTGTNNNIAVSGCSNVTAYGLNDNDDIAGTVGGCSSWPNGGGAFVKRAGTVYQVVVPGCQAVRAYDINNAGVVVGVCNDKKGEHGFIATPK